MQQGRPHAMKATVRESSRLWSRAFQKFASGRPTLRSGEAATECARITCHIETVYERREIKKFSRDTTLVPLKSGMFRKEARRR